MLRLALGLVLTLGLGLPPLQAADGPPPHDGGSVAPAPVATLATWPAGTFLESLALTASGDILVANHEHGALERVPASGGTPVEIARLPGAITGLMRWEPGRTLATGRAASGPGSVWLIGDDGAFSLFAEFPDALFLNGLTRLDEGSALIADSSGGSLWRLDLESRTVSLWVRDPLLAHRDAADRFPTTTAFPAANGIERQGQRILASNSDRGQVLAIAIQPDGSAGAVSVLHDRLLADDAALGPDGTLYAPTHPLSTIVAVAPDGTRRTIATGAEGVVGPTAVLPSADGQGLLVVTNSLIPWQGTRGEARLLKVQIAAPPAQIPTPILFAVRTRTLPDSEPKRQAAGQDYLRFLQANYGRIAFGAQQQAADGSVPERLYLLKAESAAEARAIMEASPYVTAGVYAVESVSPMRGMLGTLLGGVGWPPR